ARRVIRIELFSEVQFLARMPQVVIVGESFPEVAAQNRPLGFESGGDLEILAPGSVQRLANTGSIAAGDAPFNQAAPDPGIAQCSIYSNGLIEITQSFGRPILRSQ